MAGRKRWVDSLRYTFKGFFEAQISIFKRNLNQMGNKWEHIFGWVTRRVWVGGWRSAEAGKIL